MTQEKWDDLVKKITSQFEVEDQGSEELDNNKSLEFYVFQGPLGKIKLQRELRPKLLDKQTLYSNRKGATASVNYVFSEDEFVDVITVFKWADEIDDWEEIDPQAFTG